MHRQAQAVILLLIGGAVLRASLGDLYLRYVKQGLRPFLIAAGILLVVAAVMTLWYEWRGRNADGLDPDDEGHAHNHAHGGPWVAWLLLAPVFGLLLIAPPALGAYSAGRSGTALQEVSDFPPLPGGDPVRLSVLDYASRAVFDEGKSLANRRVRLSGFLVAAPDGGWYLARMQMSCCAADSRPVKVALDGKVPGGLAADGWLRVDGRYTGKSAKDTVNGERIPYLEVSAAQVITAPTEQYE
jgi:uncharacterized repeat protein (TIGR03943 family)